MEFEFEAKGHENVRSQHKTTFEVTTDNYLTPQGDCIIGVNSNTTLNDIPEEMKEKIRTDKTKITIILKTAHATDTITGEGSSKLTLTHPSDMVIRKSTFTCDRTLMINADKAAKDLKTELINDLKNCEKLRIIIKIENT